MKPSHWPRLSDTLPHLNDPRFCGACGTGEKVTIWIEHDEHDKPELKFVSLCLACADKIIEPHPRLYAGMGQHTPFPGVMEICHDCTMRVGLRCTSPLAKFNGGKGINISASKPFTAFMDGTRTGSDGRRRKTGWIERMYPDPPTNCSGRQFIPHT
jgi:hypothetical protein